MKINSQTITINNLVRLINDNEFNFNHPIQRGEEQWNNHQKTKLIDSLLRGFPIDSPRIVSTMVDNNDNLILENGRPKKFNIVVDGKQRMLGAIAGYYNNVYKLTKIMANCPPAFSYREEAVTLDSLIGIKYEDLVEPYKTRLDETNVTIIYLEEVSEWELRELFRRQNGGKTLSKAQMNNAQISPKIFSDLQKISEANRDYIEEYSITTKSGRTIERSSAIDNFWYRFLGKGSFRNGDYRNVIIASMMFISEYKLNNGTYDFGLKNTDIEEFLVWFDKQPDEFRTVIIDKTILAAQTINEAIKVKQTDENGKMLTTRLSIKKTSIPMLVAGMSMAIDADNVDNYINACVNFLKTYKDNVEYKALVGDGTATKDKVNARMAVFMDFVFAN